MDQPSMDQLEVEFRSDSGGTFPMTWGQQAFWQQEVANYGEKVQNFNIPMVVDLPVGEPAGQATVVAALRRLVERNQALRAHFLDGLDGPLQQIASSGTFTLRLCRATPEDSRARADELAAALITANFDHRTEWGLRIGLVCAGEWPRHVVFGFSHAMVDGGGIRALIDDLLALLHSEPPPRWQPADQVAREQTQRSARRNRAAIDYWRKQSGRIPASMFPDPVGPPARPRFQLLRLDSRALAATAPRLAASCRVSVPSVLLAGLAMALTALTGQPTCGLTVVSGNRYDEDLRGMVGTAAQDGLFVVSVSGTVAEAVRATHRAARSAYFYGYYDPADLGELRGELAAERGAPFELNSIYNDLSGFLDAGDAGDAASGVPEADARNLLADSVIVPEPTWEGQDCRIYLETLPGRDVCSLSLVADTAYLPPATMRALLRGIETIVLDAAYRDVAVSDIPALTGLRPVTRGSLPS